MGISARKYELIENGNNIHVTEQNSINNTQRIIRDVCKRKYKEDQLLQLFREVGKAQVRAWDRKESFNGLVNQTFKEWELSSNIINGEKGSMNKLDEWQKCLVERLKEIKDSKKVVFNDMCTHWEITVVVDVASTRLTYNYSKLFNSFRDNNNEVQFTFCIRSKESYSNENNLGIVMEL